MVRIKIGNVRTPIDYLKSFFAPAGYGIGEDIKQYIKSSDVDDTFVNGLYWVTCIGSAVEGQIFNYALLRVSGSGTAHCIQELFPLGMDIVLIRRCFEGNWPAAWGKFSWSHSTNVEGF
jgi:hypothetical protein